MNNLFRFLIFGFFFQLSLSVEAHAEPEREDILRAINLSLAGEYAVGDLRFKIFPLVKDPSRGRISVAGTLTSKQKRLKLNRNGRDHFRAMLDALSVPTDRHDPILNTVSGRSQINVYEVAVAVGETSDFSGTFNFVETVDGAEIVGSVDHSFCCRAISGVQLSQFDFIEGDEKYRRFLDSMNYLWDYESNHIPKLAAVLFARLDGAKIVHMQTGDTIGIIKSFDVSGRRFLGSWNKQQKNERIGWVQNPGRPSIFTNDTVSIDVRQDFQLYNNFTTYKAGEVKQLEISVIYPYDADFSKLCIGLDDVAGWAAGPYKMCWDGSRFASSNNRYSAVNNMLTRKRIAVVLN